MAPTRPAPRRRILLRILWAIPVLLVLTLAGGSLWLYLAGTAPIETLIETALKKRGFSDPRIRLGSLTPGSIRLDVSLGTGIAARDVLIRFTPEALLEGRIDAIDIGDMRLVITADKNRAPHIDGLPVAPSADNGTTATVLPALPPITIRRAEMNLAFGKYQANSRFDDLFLVPAPGGGLDITGKAMTTFRGPASGSISTTLSAHADSGLTRADIRLKATTATIMKEGKRLTLRMAEITAMAGTDGAFSARGRGSLTVTGWTPRPLPEADITFAIGEKAAVSLTQPIGRGQIAARLTLEDWRGPGRRAELAVQFSDLRIDTLLERLQLPAPRYRITVNGDLTTAAPWSRLENLIAHPQPDALPAMTARLSLAATPRLPPARVRALSLQGDIEARLEGGMLDIQAAAPWSARGLLIAPEIRPRPTPFLLRLADVRSRIPLRDLLRRNTDAAISASGRLNGDAANIGRVESGFRLRLPLTGIPAKSNDPGLLLPGLDLMLERLSLRPDPAISLPAAALQGTIGIAGSDDGFAAAFALNGRWAPRQWPAGLMSDAAPLNARGRIRLTPGGGMRLFLRDCLPLPPLRIRQEDMRAKIDDGRLCAAGTEPVLTRNGDGTMNARFTVPGGRLAAAFAGLDARGTLPAISARLSLKDMDDIRGKVEIAGGLLDEDRQKIRARAIAASATLHRQGGGLSGQVMLEKLRLEDRARRRRIAPLTISGKARLREDTLTGRLSAASAGGNLALYLDFIHDIARGRGKGEYWSKPLRFDGKEYDIATILPVLATMITETRGEADISGRLNWSGETGLRATGTLAVRGGGGQTTLFAFQGLETISRFSSLWPPQSQGVQSIYLDLLDPGLPLTAGRIRYSLPGNGTFRLEKARFAWAGGELEMPETVIDTRHPRQEFVLRAKDISLGSLFQVLAVDGLTGIGRLQGRLPVRIEGERIYITGGVLQSQNGNLRYRPAEGANPLAMAGDSPELLARALDDFRYRSLKITLDGELTGKLNIRLSLDGANPQLYDGYPFAVALSVEAEFATLLRRGLAIYTLPDKIGGRITQKRGEQKQGKK